jgi:molybdopterin-guanine dinucleotide biosynthesis protein
MIKLSVFLNREEDAYLESLASTAKFSGGKKLSKTKLIEAMVRAYRQSGIDVRGVKDDEELFRRVAAQLR